MLRIVATITNFASKSHVGGDEERYSVIINVPTKNIPKPLKDLIQNRQDGKITYETVSLSILEED